MIMLIQIIVSCELKLIDDVVVVFIGFIYGGNCLNIILNEVEMVGIICIFNEVVCDYIYELFLCKVKVIVESMGVEVEFMLLLDYYYFIMYNDLEFIKVMLFIMQCIVGVENMLFFKLVMGVEDFLFF